MPHFLRNLQNDLYKQSEVSHSRAPSIEVIPLLVTAMLSLSAMEEFSEAQRPFAHVVEALATLVEGGEE